MSEARKPTKYVINRRYDDVIKYYDSLTDEEWAAEDEAAFNDPNNVVVVIPRELLPAVHKLLTEYADQQEEERRQAAKKRLTAPIAGLSVGPDGQISEAIPGRTLEWTREYVDAMGRGDSQRMNELTSMPKAE